MNQFGYYFPLNIPFSFQFPAFPLLQQTDPSNRPEGSPIKLPSLKEIGILERSRVPSVHQETHTTSSQFEYKSPLPKDVIQEPIEDEKPLSTESGQKGKIWDLVRAA